MYGNYGVQRGDGAQRRAREAMRLALDTPLEPLSVDDSREPFANLRRLQRFVEGMPRLLDGVPAEEVIEALRDPDHPTRPAVLALVARAIGGVDPGDLKVEMAEGFFHKPAIFIVSHRATGERLAAVPFVELFPWGQIGGAFARELKSLGAVDAAVRRSGYDGPPLTAELLDAGTVGSLEDRTAMGMFVTRFVPGGRTLSQLLKNIAEAEDEEVKQAAFEILREAFRATGWTTGTLHRISAVPLADRQAREIPEEWRASAILEEFGRTYPDLVELLGVDDLPEMVARAGRVESGPAVRDYFMAALTHSDLHMHNVVIAGDGHAWLIDLEEMANAIGDDQRPRRAPSVYANSDEEPSEAIAEGSGDPMSDVDGIVMKSHYPLEAVLGAERLAELYAAAAAGYEAAWPQVPVRDRVLYVHLASLLWDLNIQAGNMRLEGTSRERLNKCVAVLAQVRSLLEQL
jgi:hypothetical protein